MAQTRPFKPVRIVHVETSIADVMRGGRRPITSRPYAHVYFYLHTGRMVCDSGTSHIILLISSNTRSHNAYSHRRYPTLPYSRQCSSWPTTIDLLSEELESLVSFHQPSGPRVSTVVLLVYLYRKIHTLFPCLRSAGASYSPTIAYWMLVRQKYIHIQSH